MNPGDSKKVKIQIKVLAGTDGSGTLTVTRTNSLGTSTIFTGPFTANATSATIVHVDYTYVSADISQVTFKACVSGVAGEVNLTNNCNSDVSLVAP